MKDANHQPMRDDDLLCERGDLIDNAAYDAICSVSLSEEDASDAIKNALEALCLDGTEIGDLERQTIEAMIPIMTKHGATMGETPEWNMEIIGSVIELFESILVQNGLPLCHPWQDEEECICYATEDRCAYCTRKRA